MIPPPFIYTYMLLLLSGDPSFKKKYFRYFIVPGLGLGIVLVMIILNGLFVIPESIIEPVYFIYMILGAAVSGILFYVFGEF